MQKININTTYKKCLPSWPSSVSSLPTTSLSPFFFYFKCGSRLLDSLVFLSHRIICHVTRWIYSISIHLAQHFPQQTNRKFNRRSLQWYWSFFGPKCGEKKLLYPIIFSEKCSEVRGEEFTSRFRTSELQINDTKYARGCGRSLIRFLPKLGTIDRWCKE